MELEFGMQLRVQGLTVASRVPRDARRREKTNATRCKLTETIEYNVPGKLHKSVCSPSTSSRNLLLTRETFHVATNNKRCITATAEMSLSQKRNAKTAAFRPGELRPKLFPLNRTHTEARWWLAAVPWQLPSRSWTFLKLSQERFEQEDFDSWAHRTSAGERGPDTTDVFRSARTSDEPWARRARSTVSWPPSKARLGNGSYRVRATTTPSWVPSAPRPALCSKNGRSDQLQCVRSFCLRAHFPLQRSNFPFRLVPMAAAQRLLSVSSWVCEAACTVSECSAACMDFVVATCEPSSTNLLGVNKENRVWMRRVSVMSKNIGTKSVRL